MYAAPARKWLHDRDYREIRVRAMTVSGLHVHGVADLHAELVRDVLRQSDAVGPHVHRVHVLIEQAIQEGTLAQSHQRVATLAAAGSKDDFGRPQRLDGIHARQSPDLRQDPVVRGFCESQRRVHTLRDAERHVDDVIHRNREMLRRDEQREREHDADDRRRRAPRKAGDTTRDHARLAIEIAGRVLDALPQSAEAHRRGGASACGRRQSRRPQHCLRGAEQRRAE